MKLHRFQGDVIVAEFSTGYCVRDGKGPRAFGPKPHFIWRPWSWAFLDLVPAAVKAIEETRRLMK